MTLLQLIHLGLFVGTSNPSKCRFGPRTQTRTNSISCNMALIPIPRVTLDQLLTPSLPTAEQYMAYWGRTSKERYNFLFESFGVGFLGVFAAYFSSFVIGSFLATFLGMIAAFWIVLAPELKAYQRNWELRGGRALVDPWPTRDNYGDVNNMGLFGSYFFGRITTLRVVEDVSSSMEQSFPLSDFEGYTMETDALEQLSGSSYKLRICISDRNTEQDQEGRDLQIHTRMREDYLRLEEGMPVCTILLSTSDRFDKLAAMTDIMVPDGGPCWVGDYPYLDRSVLEQELTGDEFLWYCFKSEGRGRYEHVLNRTSTNERPYF